MADNTIVLDCSPKEMKEDFSGLAVGDPVEFEDVEGVVTSVSQFDNTFTVTIKSLSYNGYEYEFPQRKVGQSQDKEPAPKVKEAPEPPKAKSKSTLFIVAKPGKS